MSYVKCKLEQSVIEAGILFFYLCYTLHNVCGDLLVCKLSK
jgi:hypothetical protein